MSILASKTSKSFRIVAVLKHCKPDELYWCNDNKITPGIITEWGIMPTRRVLSTVNETLSEVHGETDGSFQIGKSTFKKIIVLY